MAILFILKGILLAPSNIYPLLLRPSFATERFQVELLPSYLYRRHFKAQISVDSTWKMSKKEYQNWFCLAENTICEKIAFCPLLSRRNNILFEAYLFLMSELTTPQNCHQINFSLLIYKGWQHLVSSKGLKYIIDNISYH